MALTFDKIKDLTGSAGLMGVDLLGSARIRDNATIGTNMTIGGILKAGNILDDDTFATATSTTLATSESIKAYVDNTLVTFPSTVKVGDLEDVTLGSTEEQHILVYDENSSNWVDMPKDIFLDEITSNLLTIETTLTVPTSATISIADAPVSSTHATNKAYVDTMLPKSGGALTGALTTNSTIDGVDIATRDGVLTSTTTTANAALPKAGGAMTGAITTNSTFDGVDIATRDGVLTSTTTTANAALPKAGGTMSGAIDMDGQNFSNVGTISLDDGGSFVTFFDTDTLSQNAADAVASQQSVKAYVDNEVYKSFNKGSLLLDGTDDRVDFNDPSTFEFNYNDNFTVSGWVYITTLVGGSMIMSKAMSSGNYTGWYFFIGGTTGLVDVSLYNDGSPDRRWKLRTQSGIAINGWYHLICTHTYSSGHTGTIFINGVKQTCDTVYDTLGTYDPRATSIDFNIGMRNTTNAGLTGYIDECAIWNVALDDDACTAVYNSGRPFDLRYNKGNYDEYTDNLIGFWRLEEAMGTKIGDLSSVNTKGTVTGGAAWSSVVPSV